MGFFRQLHRSPFWSQLLLGFVAILVLPETQAILRENATNAEINQQIIAEALSEHASVKSVVHQHIHLLNNHIPTTFNVRQAVTFGKFFARSYRFITSEVPPIRAGPFLR
ncbi:secA translation cis-regulator SecM [Otariodibacter sp.]|uniref:secA translation cis-regulator SecM n=1 Tax=Otariodibacter sp. TaxID=3030919 RepID=UPI00260226B3|nr:secA translation cis-regulator SecM [Otariodibacter sp.]